MLLIEFWDAFFLTISKIQEKGVWPCSATWLHLQENESLSYNNKGLTNDLLIMAIKKRENNSDSHLLP